MIEYKTINDQIPYFKKAISPTKRKRVNRAIQRANILTLLKKRGEEWAWKNHPEIMRQLDNKLDNKKHGILK